MKPFADRCRLLSKSHDPVQYQAYRRAASQVVREQYRQAPRSEHWRCTANVLYLLENQNLREGFFRTTESPISVQPARVDDWPSISAIIHHFDGAHSRRALEQWWRDHSDSFFVVRDEQGGVQGFYQAIMASKVHKNVFTRDPLATSWSEDKAAALWLRRRLDRDTGEGPSSGQAACRLDIKAPIWNCVHGCAGSIPATVMRSSIAARSTPASGTEVMYSSEVRWRELRRLPSSGSQKPRIEAAVRSVPRQTRMTVRTVTPKTLPISP